MAVIEEKEVVRISHIGKDNLLTNKGILFFLENVACRHSDLAGYGCLDVPQTHLSWVLLHWKVQIFKRAFYGDTLTVKTWARNAHKFFTLRDFEIYDEKGTLLCIASSKWSLVNTETMSVARVTDEILAKYHKEEKSVFLEDDIVKLKEPELSASPSFTFSVLRRDIDFNHHMHNTYYLDYAYEALPKEVYEESEKNCFEILYKTSAKLGDFIDCYYTQTDNSHFVIMKHHETNHLNAIIKLYEEN